MYMTFAMLSPNSNPPTGDQITKCARPKYETGPTELRKGPDQITTCARPKYDSATANPPILGYIPDSSHLLKRHISGEFIDALTGSPIVALIGARQVGKSTLAQTLSGRNARYVTCDDPTTLAACGQDPVGFLESCRDVLTVIDEVQRAPELVLPLKMQVDSSGQRPGQFILTGSVDIFGTAYAPDSLAGRIDLMRIHPLSVGEKLGRSEPAGLCVVASVNTGCPAIWSQRTRK